MSKLSIPIVTLRLVIRQAVRIDMRGWSALYRSPKVRQYMNGPLKRSAQDWWVGLQRLLASVEQPLSIVLPETNELVGVCGYFESKQRDEWEVWLLLRSKFWKKAIGAEVTSALVETAFDSFSAKRVIGIVDPANYASLNMLKKLGFVFTGEYSGTSQWQNGHHIYGVERSTHNQAYHQGAESKKGSET